MERVRTIVRECVGRELRDASGDTIGTIKGVYVDDQTSQPEWFAVDTEWNGDDVNFVPIHGTDFRGADVISAYSTETVKDSPHVAPNGHLSPDDERELFEYYERSDVAVLRQPDTSAPLAAADLGEPVPSPSERLANDPGQPLLNDTARARTSGDRTSW